eukprot:TRINITY_DN11568_c0_g2_i3.p1 TRINITY_DN11568_c0_g2~~TRINITY_DN11568_c0_g2_i3.p1  ORF type:complete len:777 (-),score=97.72 TRINITY_DN11568_c0_g2_i3:59-2389(-)
MERGDGFARDWRGKIIDLCESFESKDREDLSSALRAFNDRQEVHERRIELLLAEHTERILDALAYVLETPLPGALDGAPADPASLRRLNTLQRVQTLRVDAPEAPRARAPELEEVQTLRLEASNNVAVHPSCAVVRKSLDSGDTVVLEAKGRYSEENSSESEEERFVQWRTGWNHGEPRARKKSSRDSDYSLRRNSSQPKLNQDRSTTFSLKEYTSGTAMSLPPVIAAATNSTRPRVRIMASMRSQPEKLQALARTRLSLAQAENDMTHFDSDSRIVRVKSLLFFFVTSFAFEASIAIIVVLNGAFLGWQVDWSIRRERGEQEPRVFTIANIVFTAIFTTELLMRLLANGRQFLSCSNNKDCLWNLFDMMLVGIGLLESFAYGSVNMSYARLIRIARFMRLMRIFRMFRFFKDLRVMVVSVTSSLKTLTWCFLCLFLLIYICAVGFLSSLTMHFEDDSDFLIPSRFSTLVDAMYVLFGSINGGIDWMDACDELLKVSSGLGIAFAVYVAFTSFCLLNIITGVFIENASRLSAQDEDVMMIMETDQRKQWIEEVKRMFQLADVNGDGTLDFFEFDSALRTMEVQILFKKLGIDALAASTRGIFELFDCDRSNSLDIDEFADGLMRFCGSAKSIDMASVSIRIVQLQKNMKTMQKSVDKLLDKQVEDADAHGSLHHGLGSTTTKSSSPIKPRKETSTTSQSDRGRGPSTLPLEKSDEAAVEQGAALRAQARVVQAREDSSPRRSPGPPSVVQAPRQCRPATPASPARRLCAAISLDEA